MSNAGRLSIRDPWPPLPLAEWKDTYDTLHMWSQIVGKVRLALSPFQNHWWHVPLYVDSYGLTTSAIPYGHDWFEMRFDFLDHNLLIHSCGGATKAVPLYPRSVADFYKEVMATLAAMEIQVRIWRMPVEIPNPIPFDEDTQHASYDPEQVGRFWRILQSTNRLFQEFRGRFIGKSSPVHFFWGSFDMAVTRFSGRRAPERPGADRITREAYSHEVSSVGFWPGGGPVNGAAFYSYAAPEPAGFSTEKVRPDAAFYHPELKEFLMMYDDIRALASPEEQLMDFCQSTYEAAANLGKWDRAALERAPDTSNRAA